MTTRPTTYGVVGGGVLGLTLALRLADRGHPVTVYERADRAGGLAASAPIGDVTWDRFYHVMLQSDRSLIALLDRLGLADDIVWKPTGTGLYDRGRWYPVSTAVDYLRLPALGPIAKARIGATVLRASRATDWRSLEQLTARQWLTRWSGAPAYRTFWEPLLRAKLGDRHDQVSAAFIWAIIQRLYAARRAGMKQDLFGYVPGGYDRILRRLVEEATGAGVDLRLGARVRSVEASEPSVAVRTTAGETMHDRVVVTAPSPMAIRLVPGLDPAERGAHAGIAYQGIVCVSVLTERPLTDYYVTNITDPTVPFTGIIEMTALVDRSEFGGRSLVYLPKYVAPDDPLFEVDDDAVVRGFVGSLAEMHRGFRPEHVMAAAVGRARHVLPLSTPGYSDRLPPVATNVPGVYIANSAHIVNGTLNTNETVELADRMLPELLAPAAAGVLR